MKTNTYIEFNESKVAAKDLTDKVKEIWKEQGGKVKDLETIDVYYKPQEGKCYYVINDDNSNSGSFAV